MYFVAAIHHAAVGGTFREGMAYFMGLVNSVGVAHYMGVLTLVFTWLMANRGGHL